MEQDARTEPLPVGTQTKSGWHYAGLALLFLATYFFVQLLVTIPYLLIVAVRTVLAEGAGDAAGLFERILMAAQAQSAPLTGLIDLLSLGAFALVLKLMHRPVFASAGLTSTRVKPLLPLLPLGLALNVLLTSLISLLPADTLSAYMEAAGQVLLDPYGVLSVLILTVLAPLTEEVLFRGLIYGNLKKALPRWLSIALASVVFGLMHGQSLWMAYTALLGAFFCIVRDRYDSLWACVLLHMAFNAGSYLVLAMQNVPLSIALTGSAAVVVACLYTAFYGAERRKE